MDKNSLKATDRRIQRIQEIKSMITKRHREGTDCNYKKILAIYCLDKGISRRTVMEYLDLLIDSGQVIKNGDELTLPSN